MGGVLLDKLAALGTAIEETGLAVHGKGKARGEISAPKEGRVRDKAAQVSKDSAAARGDGTESAAAAMLDGGGARTKEGPWRGGLTVGWRRRRRRTVITVSVNA